MQPVVRSTLVGLLTIAGLAACGDKVNVTQPPTPTLGTVVHTVTVTPSSASLAIGDKFQFGASVDADQGVTDRTVTWTSANTTVATVDATGLVTAQAAGTTSITAKSKADPNVSGSASVTVAAVVAATVTIGQINQTVCVPNGACTSVPAVLSNVAGQLDVTLNVDAGTQKISQVQLLMNCGGADTVVGTQGFSIAPPASSAEESAAPVTISFNTAGFNATTGAVAFKNGTCTLKARATTTTGTQTATSSTQITLNNVSFLSVSPITTTPGTGQVATATDGNGLTWRAGSVVVTVVPIIYSNATIATANVSLLNGGNDAAIGQSGSTPASVAGGGTIGTLSGLTPTAGVITATFPLSTSATGGVGGAVVDTLSVSVNTADSNGNPGPSINTTPTTPTVNPAAQFIRLDNRAPNITSTAPTFIAGTQNTANGWVGKAFVFSVAAGSLNLGSAATDNQVNLPATSSGGVDKVVANTQSAPSGTTTWTTFTAVTSLAETPAATGSVAYDLRLMICDALGNCANSGVLTTFGVDLTAPTQVKGSVPKDKEIVGIGSLLSSTTLQVAGTDPQGANGVTGSGFGSNPVLVQETQLTSSGATGQTLNCVIGTAASTAGTGCKTPFVGNAFASPQTVALTTTNPGQYSLVYQVTDQAGNLSAADSIRYYIDNGFAPSMSGGISIPANITNGAAFTASGVDDMDFASVNAVLTYGAIKLQIAGTSSAAGVAFDNTLTRASTATVTLSNFIRQLGTMDGAGVVAGETKPSQISIRGVDAANNLSTGDIGTFPGNNITTGVSLAGTTLGFTITSDQATLSNGTSTAATPPKSATLTATVNALNANASTPFAQVCFYVVNPSGAEAGQANAVSGGAAGELFLLGCTATTTTILNGSQKQILATMAFDPNSLYGTSGTLNLVAIGITSAGDAVQTAAPVTITLAN
jgi:Bacterial Ig-like domain (group 2)